MISHRRLSILDLSPAAAQPMVDPVSGHVVALNGEIYNYVELRQRLAASGHRFESTGDTAVMLRTLSVYGQEAIRELRGMFAFSFWNIAKRQIILARDPLGIKPLYIARNVDPRGNWNLMFASEIRAILASRLLGTPRLNPAAPASIAWNGFMVAPESAVSGIEALLPGELRVFDSAGREAYRQHYCGIAKNAQIGEETEAGVAQALEESVRLHLVSDVPLGVFLSGGIDSSAVANLAQRASHSRINTFTLAFDEAEYNEGAVGRRVADAIGTKHQELLLTEDHFLHRLEAALDSLDQPSFDGLNSYYMSHAVRQAGFKVALVGSGGDELFGGYRSFRDLPKLWQYARRAKLVPGHLRAALAACISWAMQSGRGSMPQQTRWAKLPEMVRRGDDLLALYQLAYALFLPEFQRRLLTEPAHGALIDGLPAVMHSRVRYEAAERSPLAAISVMEQRLFLGERLLRDTDGAGMSASIEIRLPLVDQILHRHVDRLPDRLRFCPVQAKALLRRIGLKGIDRSLFERPKSGFVLPYDRWLRAGLGKRIDGTMRDDQGIRATGLNPDAVLTLWQAFLAGAPGLYWSRVWAIYVFLRWCHRNRVYL